MEIKQIPNTIKGFISRPVKKERRGRRGGSSCKASADN